ncbi:YdcF family protein [Tropicibacter oceani]|uniref:YdcF family protein n=1 Tax=Tropicibacter oceani TaxID=3058420 RepID=A0ABY8QKC7_9RHOB|nr:YdcF family protein [Tropicibacter oceani]WGW05075.1 YdcF family protein [Tropicibacter oceani]
MKDDTQDQRPVAVVLGAAVWSGGRPSPTLRRRALHAATLWLSGEVRAIVACGGLGQNPPSEAEVIAALCRAAGVPEGAIFLEDRSTTTDENLRFAMPILQGLGAADVVIVTDRYHAPRARLIGRRLGLTVRCACPPLSGAKRRRVLRQYLREGPAYFWYWLRKR